MHAFTHSVTHITKLFSKEGGGAGAGGTGIREMGDWGRAERRRWLSGRRKIYKEGGEQEIESKWKKDEEKEAPSHFGKDYKLFASNR